MASGSPHLLARLYLYLIAALIGVTGLVLLGGGIWLLVLGGSWFYAVAGALLTVSALYLFLGRMVGFWIYILAFILTAAWAWWEKGFNLWAQVPRLAAPLVLLVLLLLAVPVLRRLDPGGRVRDSRMFAAAAIATVAFGVGALAQPLWSSPSVIAQAEVPTPGQVPAPEAPLEEAPTQGAPTADPQAAPAATMPMLETGADWPAYGGNLHATRYSPLAQITRDNVGQLEQVWEYRTGDMPEVSGSEDYSPETTPLKVGDDLYMCSAMGIILAVDGRTGREEWRFDPQVSIDAIPYGATCRGVAYYATPDADPGELCATRILMGTLDARLIAVDARLGQLCTDFGLNGQVSLETGIGETVPSWYSVTSPPTVVRGVAVLGAQVLDGQARDAPSGVIRGYDAVTGELRWAWDLANPELTGLPPEGETYSRGTPNMWTIASGDEELGYVYLPMGNSAVDYYGAERTDLENEYATSLVALDVTTGLPAWHFQTVRYDVWDYDLGSQATLIDFPTAEGPVPALLLPSKQGDIYVLNRETGEPLVGFEDRPVPTGGVEPENLSPTQPFSLYHTVAQPDLVEADMWGMTLIDQMICRIQFRQAAYDGMYTPPTVDRYFIQYPGYNGGSDWGGIAVDPVRGIIIANYNDMPNHNRLVHREEADAAGLLPINVPGGGEETALGEAGPQAGVPYAIQVNAGWRMPFTGLLCKEPPYGGIRAIDIATGDTIWDQPFGTARKNGPFGLPSFLPVDIGTPNNGGSVVTASGLVFIAAATDDLFRAFDIETGEVVWQVTLPAGGQANPFTYEVEGKQYVGIMAGGHHFMETPIGDYVLAWALP